SGAVGAGMGKLGVESYPRLIPDRQAVAAVGQVQLMKMWEHAFAAHKRQVGQVLVTAADLQSRYRYVNMQNTFASLLRMGVIPVVNENDSAAVRELKYGDNDALSVQVAGTIDAEMLVLLTATDGLYTANPEKDPQAGRIPVVEEVTAEISRIASGKSSGISIGGMRSKLDAASLAGKAGIWCVIASGIEPDLVGIIEGRNIGTLFVPRADGLKRRKHWIAFTSRSKGVLIVDGGAHWALSRNGKSLLSSGIKEAEGKFESGDVVDITTAGHGKPFARGVTSYSSEDLSRIKGLHSSRIEQVLGHVGPEEVVHKDNLVLL
ncbi:glutamate 5-kinase, partial [Gemmatimonadota bacterium]